MCRQNIIVTLVSDLFKSVTCDFVLGRVSNAKVDSELTNMMGGKCIRGLISDVLAFAERGPIPMVVAVLGLGLRGRSLAGRFESR